MNPQRCNHRLIVFHLINQFTKSSSEKKKKKIVKENIWTLRKITTIEAYSARKKPGLI